MAVRSLAEARTPTLVRSLQKLQELGSFRKGRLGTHLTKIQPLALSRMHRGILKLSPPDWAQSRSRLAQGSRKPLQINRAGTQDNRTHRPPGLAGRGRVGELPGAPTQSAGAQRAEPFLEESCLWPHHGLLAAASPSPWLLPLLPAARI